MLPEARFGIDLHMRGGRPDENGAFHRALIHRRSDEAFQHGADAPDLFDRFMGDVRQGQAIARRPIFGAIG